jgi:hypothetical protein
MAIPAMSAPLERVFSSGGDIITRKMSRLSLENKCKFEDNRLRPRRIISEGNVEYDR